MTTSTAISILAAKISTGDLDSARTWATANADALGELRHNGDSRGVVADACNRYGASMVWPWGDTPTPTKTEMRVLVAMRSGKRWAAAHGTIASILAFGWARFDDGVWHVTI